MPNVRILLQSLADALSPNTGTSDGFVDNVETSLARISQALPEKLGGKIEAESLAAEYDDQATYDIGDYCTHDGVLYICTTAIATAESWNSAKWVAVPLIEILQEKLNAPADGAVAGRYLMVGQNGEPVWDQLDESDIRQSVYDWLSAHPEAIVVNDGTITRAKLDTSVGQAVDKIDDLSNDVSELKADLTQLDSDVDILRDMATGDLTWAQIQRIVQAGNAEKWFSIGDQLEVEWTDTNGATHTLPFDVVSFAPVVKEGENTESPGMWLESHYAMKPVQFDQNEAFYVLPDALPAGTYHFTFGTTWGSKDVVSGDSYSFTTTRAYPAGAQFVIGSATSDASSLPDTLSSTWRIRTYENPSDTAPAEILSLTAGASGVSLGTITSSIKYADSGLNNLQRAGYGYNRWAMSAMRQWLNSDADVGAWWTPSNPFDRAPTQLGTYKGFMSGFDADFLAALAPIKVTTALNTVSDSAIGATEDTYDTFFLASLEQEYIVPWLAGAEGAYWPYWKERLGLDSPQAWYADGTNENHIRYAYNATTSAQYCRLRSASRGGAGYTWYVSTTGYANYGGDASSAYRGCPACVIA